MIKSLLPFIIAIIISLLMTPLVRKFAFKIDAVDIPKDNRRVHKEPMPLIGGLAIYTSVVICTLIFVPMRREIIGILIGSSVILLSGIIDDKGALGPKKKLAFQIVAALIIIIIGDVKIEFITNPFHVGRTLIHLERFVIPATIFWIIGITNTLNLIDGLDGLAAGVAGISSLSLMMVAARFGYTPMVILAMIVAGACIGFLPFNFNPAKIFMGDTGSLFLGFMLAVIAIEGSVKSAATIAIIVPIVILVVPIFDTTFAIFRRLRRGESITSADKSHLHHRLLAKGYSQRKTVLILYGISIVFGIFAVLVARSNNKQGVYSSIIMVLLTVIYGTKAGMFGKKENKGE